MIKKVNDAEKKAFFVDSYLILQKNGISVGQSVPHIHFHYIPQKNNPMNRLKFLVTVLVAGLKEKTTPLEIKESVEKLKKNF